jgi:hypothetical protein
MMNRLLRFALVLLVTCLVLGCGGSGPDPERFGIESEELEYAKSVRAMLEDLQSSFEQEGLEGLRSGLEGAVENLAAFESQPTGDHTDTYRRIHEAVTALQSTVDGSPSNAEVQQHLDKLMALADELPQGDSASSE